MRPFRRHRSLFAAVATVVLCCAAVISAQDRSDPLTPATAIEGPINGGESRDLLVNLRAGEFARVTVLQQNIDLAVEWLAPGGRPISTTDSYNSINGPEDASILAAATGEYVVRVTSSKRLAPAGRFRATLDLHAVATEADRVRLIAEQLGREAKALFESKKQDQRPAALPKLTAALDRWESLRDQYYIALTQETLGYYEGQLGAVDKALAHQQEALAHWRSTGDLFAQCTVLNEIGHTYNTNRDAAKALQQYGLVADFCGSHGVSYWHAWGEYNQGSANRVLAQDYKAAADHYIAAIPLLRANGDLEYEAEANNDAAYCLASLGQNAEALPLRREAVRLIMRTDNLSWKAQFVKNLAAGLTTLQKYDEARQTYVQALPLARELARKDPTAAGTLADTFSGLIKVANFLGRQAEAEKWLSELGRLGRDTGDVGVEAHVLDSVGDEFYSKEEYAKALDYHQRAARLLRAQDRTAFAGTVYSDLASDLYRLDRYQEAADYLRRSIAIRKDLADEQGQADALRLLGECLYNENELEDALKAFERAFELYQRAGNEAGVADALQGEGEIFDQQGKFDQALEMYSKALEIFTAKNRLSDQSLILDYIGTLYYAVDQTDKAKEFYEKALEIAVQHDLAEREADVRSDLGDVYSFRNDTVQAVANYQRALEIYRQIERMSAVATTLNSLGQVQEKKDDYQEAIRYYEEALKISTKLGNESAQSLVFSNLGDVYSTLKETDKALDYYRKALDIDERSGAKWNIPTSVRAISGIYYDRSEYGKALEYARRSLTASTELHDRSGEAASYNRIGLIFDSLGYAAEPTKRSELYASAADNLLKGLAIARDLKDQTTEGTILLNLGINAYYRDDYPEAQRYIQGSLDIRRSLNDDSGRASCLYWLARMNKYLGRYGDAANYIAWALTYLENIRTRITSDDLRATYAASVQNYYELYIDCLMQIGDDGSKIKAFETSERSHARVLLELLEESHVDIRQGVDADLVQREKHLKTQMFNIDAAIAKAGQKQADQRQRLMADMVKVKAELASVESEIRSKSPVYAGLTQPKDVKLADIQHNLLDDDSVVLEYALGSQRSYLWVVGKHSFSAFVLADRTKIEQAARDAHGMFSTSQNIARGGPKGRKRAEIVGVAGQKRSLDKLRALTAMILAPAAEQIKGKRVAVVADGALSYVPFAALPQPGAPDNEYKPLILSNEIVSLPSIAALQEIRKRPSPLDLKTMQVFADPVFSANDERVREFTKTRRVTPSAMRSASRSLNRTFLSRSLRETGGALPRLEGTLREAQNIRALITDAAQAEEHTSFDANRANALKPDLSNYRYVHFATHGLLNTVQPELSGIALSMVDQSGQPQDGFLRLGDVFNLNLPADMVVLSACQTGLGKEVRGEGMIGLTRGFMYAGARRVVVSLWSISDDGTAEFMTRFYKLILKEGRTPAAALREAQISMFSDTATRRFNQPYYWAAFTLQGEWR